jgi:predicted DCC family thiol-disulfide oxidoreductase YuxK
VPERTAIVLFDGTCAFCERSVTFVARRDPAGYFRFGAAQAPEAAGLLAKYGISAESSRTILLIEDDRVYLRSTAVLRIARRMRWPWPLASAFLAVPRVVRDGVYSAIARVRHRIAGRQVCAVPPPELRSRLITR